VIRSTVLHHQGTASTYVNARLGKKGETQNTPVRSDTRNPVFNFWMDMGCTSAQTSFTLSLMDQVSARWLVGDGLRGPEGATCVCVCKQLKSSVCARWEVDDWAAGGKRRVQTGTRLKDGAYQFATTKVSRGPEGM
jgi:hypothetical protein